MMPQHYMRYMNNQLVSAVETAGGSKLPEHVPFIHSQFRSLVLAQQFPCAGAKTAINQATYRYGVYSNMGSETAASALGEALGQFVKERPAMDSGFTTFIASFTETEVASQSHFTDLLWKQLQTLHECDLEPWDKNVSSDPDAPEFSFSFAGCSFFVIGMHAGSPRWSRRFAWPTLVFNAHDQFELLRSKGDFERFKQVVRKRDFALQGSMNVILEDHGKSSEALQYSGGIPHENWKCPFKHKNGVIKHVSIDT